MSGFPNSKNVVAASGANASGYFGFSAIGDTVVGTKPVEPLTREFGREFRTRPDSRLFCRAVPYWRNIMKLLGKSLLALTAFSAALLAGVAIAGDDENDQSHPGNVAPAMNRFYSIVREPALSLADHTVFMPADLDAFGPRTLPVVFWANGGCSPSNYGFTFLLTILASHGFVVIANGAYYAEPGAGTVTPSKLIAAMDWAQSSESRRQFDNRLDLNKVAVAGQSCGGLEALVAGADSRVKTVLALNTGFFPTPLNGYGREQLANLHVPVLWVNGGPTDVAYQNSIDNYNILLSQHKPVYLASNAHAGHSGLWFGIRDGVGNTAMLAQAEAITTNWLDYFLNGNSTAASYFFGSGCGLCVQPEWTVTTNIQ
jgi:dienelactone hydrolase